MVQTICQSRAKPLTIKGRCRDWTGSTLWFLPMVKGQSRPQTVGNFLTGDESRSGMNPGVVGSNPTADTIVFFLEKETFIPAVNKPAQLWIERLLYSGILFSIPSLVNPKNDQEFVLPATAVDADLEERRRHFAASLQFVAFTGLRHHFSYFY